jgi:two-component system, chemotaxis family, sensor kinase CheA
VSDPDADLREVFREEATGRLDEAEQALLAIEAGGESAGLIDSLFRNLHTIKGTAGMVGHDDVSAVAHAAEEILADAREAGELPAWLADPLLHATKVMRARVRGQDAPVDELLAELTASRAAMSQPGTPPAGSPASPGPPPGERPAREQPPPAVPHPRPRSVRVPPGRIDHLLDLVGEVTQDGRRLRHVLGPEPSLPEAVTDLLGATGRSLAELKDIAIRMRTMPLAMITSPLPRVVRDLAREAGKDISLTVTGADTELDRVILESLVDPLMHLIRNAVAHGIEAPRDRERTGKPRQGRIELRALPRGGLVEITVADDGRGISPEVAERAREEGSLADVLGRAGFSTAETVSELAGRGVGLDAVRSYAHSMGGGFEVRSEPGHGMEVVLLLPLALALMNVLLFERGGAVFGVPLAAVAEVTTVPETVSLQGRASVTVRGRAVPVADAAALLGVQAPALGERPPAFIITVLGRQHAVTCDLLHGEAEVVVKPLGSLLAGVPGYLGGAILGDGRVALLVEPSALTRPRSAPAPQGAPQRPAAPRRVMIVEDSFTVRELQRSILETAGYQVVTAHDGNEALRALSRDAEIALVLTDLEMPELDGLGLTRAIRADPARASLPVVIVTAQGSQEDQRKGIEAGADAYMVKRNFDQQALLATVERLIGR